LREGRWGQGRGCHWRATLWLRKGGVEQQGGWRWAARPMARLSLVEGGRGGGSRKDVTRLKTDHILPNISLSNS